MKKRTNYSLHTSPPSNVLVRALGAYCAGADVDAQRSVHEVSRVRWVVANTMRLDKNSTPK